MGSQLGDHQSAESAQAVNIQAVNSSLMDASIEVLECPPLHSGLGVGTQLAAAVAMLARQALIEALPSRAGLTGSLAGAPSVSELARIAGRGKRSAIGLHGFLNGGLVQDLGYVSTPSSIAASQAQSSRPIATHSCLLPQPWRVVLIASLEAGDVHGAREEHLIGRAAAQPNPQRDRMLELSRDCMQLAQEANFADFIKRLDEYMLIAATLFEPVQAGRYRDHAIADRVRLAESVGLVAVGQSSWGPTVFGFTQSVDEAHAAVEKLNPHLDPTREQAIVARPAQQGARWTMVTNQGVQHAG
ncbi:MAG: hypothetical protein IT423_15050 [Pirellulaceae bacterium]|nr:hypothetical protein [Pirellulaceae bacterium]